MKKDEFVEDLMTLADEFYKTTGVIIHKIEFELQEVNSIGSNSDKYTPIAVHLEYK